MPKNQESLNRKLYNTLLRYEPDTLDSDGKITPVPEDAEVFQFKFPSQEDASPGNEGGTVAVSIEGANKLVIYFDDSVTEVPGWSQLLISLKNWAQGRQLGFQPKNRNHLNPDMAKRKYMTNKEKVAEGYYATGKKSSYSDAVPAVKIILQHNRQLEEGEARYRSIAKIFVENADGERFLLPTNKPGIARVYARHIAEGGTPYDDAGKHINSLVEEYTKMAGFVRATRNNQFNESTQSLVNEGIQHYQSLRETLHKMSGRKGYQSYFESWSPTLTEDTEDTTDLSEMFSSNSLDPRIESVMPILRKLNKSISEMTETTELSNWADELVAESMGDDLEGVAEGVAEGAKWRSDPDAYDVDDEGNKTPRNPNTPKFGYDPLQRRADTANDAKTPRGKTAALKTSLKMAKGNKGVAEAEKNPHTSALGKALHRDLSKEKKASPAQVEQNKANWAKNAYNPANKQQGDTKVNKEELELDEADKISTAQMGHAGKTTIKHIKNPDVTQRMAAHDVKSYADRIALLKDAKRKGNLKEEEMNEELHPDADKVLKHIKPEHHAKYTPDLTTKHYTGNYADRTAVLKAAEHAGHLKESAFDWKNAPREKWDKTKTSTYHDVKKISTGTVYTKQFDKDGTSKGTGDDAAKKAEGAAKRGRGRPKKDKFAESVEILMSLSEEQFDSMMEDGFDTFFEAYEQLDEASKAALKSCGKSTK